ncbi:MAG: acyl-CoA dehydrogenase, partial [Candidatus Binatia bacterium]
QAEWLPGIAAGTTTAAVAHAEPVGRWDADGITTTAHPDGNDVVLTGTKSFVVDGHTADLLLIAARAPGTTGATGIRTFLVPATTRGVERRVLGTMDETRRLAEIHLDGVRVPQSAALGGDGAGWPALATTLHLATVALAAEQVGGAERCLDLAVSYAGERVQFGRPIGSFQAIKHKCADMLMRVEAARSATYYAACTADDRAELATAASLAKAYCSDAYFQCAADSLQIHGGVGFTWEYDVHLYFKRAKSSESLLGDATYHRELVARQLAL